MENDERTAELERLKQEFSPRRQIVTYCRRFCPQPKERPYPRYECRRILCPLWCWRKGRFEPRQEWLKVEGGEEFVNESNSAPSDPTVVS